MMKLLSRLFGRKEKKNIAEPEPVKVAVELSVVGCIPMSFGVMFKCEVSGTVVLRGSMPLKMVNGGRSIALTCINVEKDYTVSCGETECNAGDTVCVTVELTDELRTFPLHGAKLVV